MSGEAIGSGQEAAERRLLGLLLSSPAQQARLLPLVRAELWAHEGLRTIASAAIDAAKKNGGRVIDPHVVALELEARGQFEAVGGWATVSLLIYDASTDKGVEAIVERLHENMIRRAYADAQRNALASASDMEVGTSELVAMAEHGLRGVRALERSSTEAFIGPLAMAAWEKWSTRAKLAGTSTGLACLDAIMPLRGGDYWVVAGESSSGKTALALQIADHVGVQGGHVGFFSLEMGHEAVTARFVSPRADVPIRRLLVDVLTEEEKSRTSTAIATVAHRKDLRVDDNGAADVGYVSAVARRWHAERPLTLVVVDYLQLLRPTDPKAVRERQIGEASTALKHLSRELDCTVMVLSQLNRQRAQRGDKKPIKTDLRDSGQIDQDADVIVFVHRDPEKPDETELIVAKTRNGQSNVSLPVGWHGPTARFTDKPDETVPQQDQSGRWDGDWK